MIGFDDGKGMATVIKRGDRYALRVKHADAPTPRAASPGSTTGRAAATGRSPARFIAASARARPCRSPTSSAPIERVPNPGAVEFERDGKTYRLEALDEGEATLFLVFADRTSGHGSYRRRALPRSRRRPMRRASVVLDFNRAYNPPCAFTPFATCPLPPPENRLDLAVDGGRKEPTPNPLTSQGSRQDAMRS